ncbi:MAG: hypothetical protein LBF63_08235, partial [Treponema sp.]|nr:hypothetical protein [Treponema sp.]
DVPDNSPNNGAKKSPVFKRIGHCAPPCEKDSGLQLNHITGRGFLYSLRHGRKGDSYGNQEID